MVRIRHSCGTARNSFEQRRVLDRLQSFLFGVPPQLTFDLGATLGEAGDHRAFVLHLFGVAVGVAKRHEGLRRLEAVALRFAAGGQPQHRHRHDIGAVQRHQPVRRADEVHAAPAICELVAHHLRDRQRGERGLQRGLQALGQRRAGHDAVEEQRLGLAVHGALERGHGSGVRAERGQFFQQRRRRLARRIERHGHRHQLLLHRLVGRLRGDVRDMRGQAARRGVRRRRRTGIEQALRPEARRQVGRE